MVKKLIKKGDIEGGKMTLICFGSNYPYRLNDMLSQSKKKSLKIIMVWNEFVAQSFKYTHMTQL